MKRVAGLACFCSACGMTIVLFLPNTFVCVLLILILLLIGYNLFCC